MASDGTKKRIGIFGGTFDPIHYGHLTIGQLALETCQLDELYFVPAGNPPHKDVSDVTDPFHRYQMVMMALAPHSQFHICDYEMKKNSPSYTLHLLTHFREQFPEADLYLVMGADSFRELELWYQYKNLFSLAHLVVMNREGSDIITLGKKAHRYQHDFQAVITLITGIRLDVSSSMVRRRVLENLSIKHLLPEGVAHYIQKEQLYQKQVKNHA